MQNITKLSTVIMYTSFFALSHNGKESENQIM